MALRSGTRARTDPSAHRADLLLPVVLLLLQVHVPHRPGRALHERRQLPAHVGHVSLARLRVAVVAQPWIGARVSRPTLHPTEPCWCAHTLPPHPTPRPGLPIDNMCTSFSAMGSAAILPLDPAKGYQFEVAIFGGGTQVCL